MTIKIVTDADFQSVVMAADKPAILAIGATWCADCRRAAPFYMKFAEELSDKMLFATADSEQNPAIVKQFNVVNIPTMVVVKDGQEVDRIVEVKTPSALREFIERNL